MIMTEDTPTCDLDEDGHRQWRDGCWKCEDGYPYPHEENDEAERHMRRMRELDERDPFRDLRALRLDRFWQGEEP